jgi:hypothetical protein
MSTRESRRGSNAMLPLLEHDLFGTGSTFPDHALMPETPVSSFCRKGISLSPVGALWMNALLA